MISLQGIGKTFKVARRSEGLRQAAKALFVREYKLVEALQDITFSIPEGEIVGYIGPNGAGKSTSIKVMSGILVPDRGTCSIMGYTPWQERRAYVQRIGVVFGQRSQLWWDVPVIDLFELLRDIYKVRTAEYKANLELLVETLDLNGLLQTPVRQLSLGQRMRCELAASLLHGPRVLFLDEPTIGLDAASKIAVRQFIKAINREKNVTVILTTHDMHDIEALASRILLIGKGRLLYDGNLDELRGRFGTKRTIVADYQEQRQRLELPGAELVSWSPERAVLQVDISRIPVSQIITRLAEQVELRDVAIEEKAIDEVILDLYKEHQL